jgi:hypothetical protein
MIMQSSRLDARICNPIKWFSFNLQRTNKQLDTHAKGQGNGHKSFCQRRHHLSCLD